MAKPARRDSGAPLLYLASGNPGKLREFRHAAADFGWVVEAVPDFKRLPHCEEDGKSFAENACKKAIHYGRFCPEKPVFADDSGICVPALDGAPGIRSARFAGLEAASETIPVDDANNRKLLQELAETEDRRAYYVCVIAVGRQGKVVTTFEGRVDGVILDKPRGRGGFGYDPYFFYEPLNRTFAELTPEEKFAVSHRGQAFRQLLDEMASGSPFSS